MARPVRRARRVSPTTPACRGHRRRDGSNGHGRSRSLGAASAAPVYIDANPLSDNHLTGIGRYTARLALALSRTAASGSSRRWRRSTPPGRFALVSGPGPGALGPRTSVGGEQSPLGQHPRGKHRRLDLLAGPPRRSSRARSASSTTVALDPPRRPTRKTTPAQFRSFARRDATVVRRGPGHLASTTQGGRHLAQRPRSRADRRRPTRARASASAATPTADGSGAGPRSGWSSRPSSRARTRTFLFDWFRDTASLAREAELWWVGPHRLADVEARLLRSYERGHGAAGGSGSWAWCPTRRCAGSTGRRAGRSTRRSTRGSASRCSMPCATARPCSPAGTARSASSTSRASLSSTPATPAPSTAPGKGRRREAPVDIPLDLLDRRYDWDRVARTLLGAARPPGRPPTPVPGPPDLEASQRVGFPAAQGGLSGASSSLIFSIASSRGLADDLGLSPCCAALRGPGAAGLAASPSSPRAKATSWRTSSSGSGGT